MFALGIRYLNGFAAASEPDDLRRAEWPPHPGRVFMALAAAHFQTGADSDERKALLWLEALENDGEPSAPRIVASDALHRAVVTHFVPVNDDSAGYKKKDKKTVVFQEIGQTGLRRNRQDRIFARAWLEDDTVYLVWPDIDPDESTRRVFGSLCGKVTRIGHSSSLVQMWVARADEVGEPNWLPDEERATIHLRIAPRGTLDYLERQFNAEAIEDFAALQVAAADLSNEKAHQAATKRLKADYPDGQPYQLRPTLSVSQGYASPPSPETNVAAGSVFSPHFMALQLAREQGPYRHLDLACALAVSQRWREALLSHSNDLSASVRAILAGHGADGAPLQDPHLAFVPLAFVGHDHADGHLLGMGVTLPGDMSREDRRGALRAIGRVRQLKLGPLGIWRVESVTAARPAWNLRPVAWTAYPNGATHWSSVTPIVFDHHPKSKATGEYLNEVATMIRLGCTRIGLSAAVREIIVTQVSAHVGVPPAYDFPRVHRKDRSPRRHTHAILVFDEPVCGPLLLGAGRYRGYGLCRPMTQSLDWTGER